MALKNLSNNPWRRWLDSCSSVAAMSLSHVGSQCQVLQHDLLGDVDLFHFQVITSYMYSLATCLWAFLFLIERPAKRSLRSLAKNKTRHTKASFDLYDDDDGPGSELPRILYACLGLGGHAEPPAVSSGRRKAELCLLFRSQGYHYRSVVSAQQPTQRPFDQDYAPNGARKIRRACP